MSPTADDTDQDQDSDVAVDEGDSSAEHEPTPEEARAEAAATFEDSEAEGSPIGEHIMQRLRYFENLVDHQKRHIAALKGALTRHGVAPVQLPNFPLLRSPLGNFDPNEHA